MADLGPKQAQKWRFLNFSKKRTSNLGLIFGGFSHTYISYILAKFRGLLTTGLGAPGGQKLRKWSKSAQNHQKWLFRFFKWVYAHE